jgi:hypothetical protein
MNSRYCELGSVHPLPDVFGDTSVLVAFVHSLREQLSFVKSAFISLRRDKVACGESRFARSEWCLG